MILCADDYGLRGDVDRAIIELCAGGRLSAVSCMVLFERCSRELLARLLAFQDRLDIGLHLCLTREAPELCPELPKQTGTAGLPAYAELLRGALTRRVSPTQVAGQVSAQYDLFVRKCGRRPDYLDGHLHAHQLPGVREGVLEFVRALPKQSRPYVRNTHLPLAGLRRRHLPWAKPALIGFFGRRMRRSLQAADVPTNDGFAGIYDFRAWQRYPEYFPRFIACLERPNGLLVVHPGEDEEWRRQELAVLRQFPFAPGQLNRFRPD